jgi:hypothetical protein
VTTERWASVLIHPAAYNSLKARKLLYLTYTYILPIINFLFLLIFPSAAVARSFSYARQSFGRDFTVRIVLLLLKVAESVLSVFSWAFLDIFTEIGSFFHGFFNWLHDHAEWVSSYIATFDQWISYFASRLVPFKQICGLIFRIAQGFGGIFYKIFTALNPIFTKILPHINHARIVPNTAGNVDMMGRLAQSGLFRRVLGKFNGDPAPQSSSSSSKRRKHPASAVVVGGATLSPASAHSSPSATSPHPHPGPNSPDSDHAPASQSNDLKESLPSIDFSAESILAKKNE